MKKFYESPIVEITVFDVEDVITASVNGGSTLELDDAQLSTLTDKLEAQYANTQVVNYGDTAYTW